MMSITKKRGRETMKKIISFVMCLAMLLFGTGVLAAETYTGAGDSQIGGAGAIEVSVTLEGDVITAVEVTKNGDTPGISDSAVTGIPAAIVAQNSIAVDTIASATMTSDAILMAVENALVTGGVDIEPFKVKKEVVVEQQADMTLEADVVIIGAGGAGMAAAVTAHQEGKRVIVVEKMPKMGGNTILAGGALNAVDDRSETAIAQNDSVEWHYQQTISGGDYKGAPALVHTLVANAWDGVEWLKGLGMEFNEEAIFTVTGGLWPRAHKPMMPVGTGFFDTYSKYMQANGEGLDLLLNTTAKQITMDADGRVDGIVCVGETGNTITIKAHNGVVVATGGFGQNIELRQAFNTQWADLGADVKSTNHAGATGDGVKMLMELGADFVQMNYIQLLPLGDPQTGSLSGNIEKDVETRIFINKEGNRFTDEGGRRDDMTRALFAQTDKTMWIVMDSDKYPTGDELNNFNESPNELVAAGRAVKADTLEELAVAMGVPAENLIAAVEDFNAHVASGEADEFGRKLYDTPIDNGPFYAGARVPTVHHTMGGVHINSDAQVIGEDGQIIPGLYAAGEVTGGIHGSNRLGGNALTDTVVYGRIAGMSAAQAK